MTQRKLPTPLLAGTCRSFYMFAAPGQQERPERREPDQIVDDGLKPEPPRQRAGQRAVDEADGAERFPGQRNPDVAAVAARLARDEVVAVAVHRDHHPDA